MHFLPAQLWPANPVIQIQVPSNELQTPWDGLVQSSGHVRSSIPFVESTAVQTCKENMSVFLSFDLKLLNSFISSYKPF